MILILGGTTEGRKAAEVIDEAGKPFFYSTKGDLQEIVCKNGSCIHGGMDCSVMTDFCHVNQIRLLIDAAHPFATQLHETVTRVAASMRLPAIRFERIFPPHDNDIVWCENYDVAINKLETDGITNLLALTGVQTMEKLRPYWQKHRCHFRILPREESKVQAEKEGFDPERLVFYDQEHTTEILLKQLHPQAILTKESGISGGFQQKVNAARAQHVRIYAIQKPELPEGFITVTGKHGLRKQVEHLLPDFFPLRSGYTTGSCATAAAKAALLALLYGEEETDVTFSLPDGEIMELPIDSIRINAVSATASVIKDAGDDPDVTNRCPIVVTVQRADHEGIRFLQGKGVGLVTLPGLGIPVGDPAINKTPRMMITNELSALYQGGLDVTISVPNGDEIALRTFNPKLGVKDGISIIGTSGIVMPFSSEAFIDAIRREVEVCIAVGSPRLVINSGAKSEKVVRKEYPSLSDQAFVHYGNFIGETLKIADELNIHDVTMGIMIGKAVKLAEGNLDTHSHKVVMNKDFLKQLAADSDCSDEVSAIIDQITLARELWEKLAPTDADRFFPAILSSCHQYCRKILPDGDLTILLIDENNKIPYRIS